MYASVLSVSTVSASAPVTESAFGPVPEPLPVLRWLLPARLLPGLVC